MSNYWFAFDWASYDQKTKELSLVEHGAYIQLLKHYYSTGLPLANNNVTLARVCGAHSEEEIGALATVLRRYFSLKSDGWHNKRADEEIAKRINISKLRAQLGKKGVLAKAEAKATAIALANELANGLANDKQNDTQFTTNNIHTNPKSKALVHFVHPTLEEVTLYCRERGNRVDPQKWVDHYSANGWKVGRNPMKDWRAAVRNWERNGAAHGADRQFVKQSRAREIASNNAAAFAAVMGGSALDFGAITQQGTEQAGTRTLAGEVKRLPERSS